MSLRVVVVVVVVVEENALARRLLLGDAWRLPISCMVNVAQQMPWSPRESLATHPSPGAYHIASIQCSRSLLQDHTQHGRRKDESNADGARASAEMSGLVRQGVVRVQIGVGQHRPNRGKGSTDHQRHVVPAFRKCGVSEESDSSSSSSSSSATKTRMLQSLHRCHGQTGLISADNSVRSDASIHRIPILPGRQFAPNHPPRADPARRTYVC
jgi:hypothetical protein